MSKKILVSIICLVIFSLVSYSVNAAELKDLEISAKYYGVYEAQDLKPVLENDAETIVPLASLTKIMTAIVCIENVNLKDEVEVDLPEVKKYYDADYSVAGLKDKQKISYYDLVETMLLPSGADSAACIALNVFSDYDKFIQAMNDKAKELGMKNTSFSNPIGSDDEKNYSTVRDIALMMKYAMENDYIVYGITQKEHTIADKSKTVHNALFQLADIYGIDIPNITGGKTGMTGDAGFCLLSYSNTTPEQLYCIVLGSEIKPGTLYHLTDTEKLYTFVKDNYTMKDIISLDEKILTLPTDKSSKESIDITSIVPVKILEKNINEIDKNKVKIEYNGLNVLTPDNKLGELIGSIDVYYDGRYISTENVILTSRVPLDIKVWIHDNPYQAALIGVLILGVIALVIRYGVKIYRKKFKIVQF